MRYTIDDKIINAYWKAISEAISNGVDRVRIIKLGYFKHKENDKCKEG